MRRPGYRALRDERTRLRLENDDLRRELSETRMALAVARGATKGEALLSEFDKTMRIALWAAANG